MKSHGKIAGFEKNFSRPLYQTVIAALLVMSGLYLASRYNYLLFHIIAEMFSIVIASCIFIVAWNSRRFSDNNYLLFLGIAYLFVGCLDFVHTLTYTGMDIFHSYGTNLSIQLWITSRYIESLSLLIAPLFLKRKLKPDHVLMAYFLVSFLMLLVIFSDTIFPVCFIEGTGLTPFKKISEYIISMILLASIVVLFQNRKEFQKKTFLLLIVSILLTIASELSFTLYISTYGFSNQVGHYFKIISFYLIYKAIIETDLVEPYELMFRNLKQSEEALSKAHDNLEQRIEGRTKELTRTNRKMVKEIEERRQAEEALHVSEAKLNILIHNIPGMVYRGTPDWSSEIISGSRALCGYSEDEFNSKAVNWLDIIYPEDKDPVLSEGLELTKKQKNIIQTYRITTKEGDIRWVEDHKISLFSRKGKFLGVDGVVIDISMRKQTEGELKKYREHLEELVEERTEELKEKVVKIEESRQALTYLLEDVNETRKKLLQANTDYSAANKELKEFAYIVSHDLKAPLRAISQLTHWISEDYNELFDADGKEQMNLILQRVKRMDGLIEGVLRYSRVGRIKEKKKRLDLNILVREVIDTLAPVDTVKILIENELPVVFRDPVRMEQVFQNLIGNAIKFMDKDDAVIKIACTDDGAYWKFSISDNGPGIDKRYHEKIFKIFQTLTLRDERESTGIGLTLVKKIVTLYGGSVRVESEKGHGATFFFTLPKHGEDNEKL